MTGYTRQDVGDNIANGNIIDADYLDQEYDAIEAAFDAATGHEHDGSTGGGKPITKIGPVQDFLSTGAALYPKIDSAYTLGTTSQRFSDVFTDSVTVGDGRFSWNSNDLTLDLVLNGTGVTLQVGQEQLIRVQNNTGVTITNGTAVKYASAIGASGYFRVAPMDASAGNERRLLLGVATEDINDGDVGFVTSQGFVRDINTSAWANGTTLWVNPAVPGALTSTEPTSPDLKLPIAVVTTSHAVNGVLYVRAQLSGSTLQEDDLVELTAIVDKDLLIYNTANGRFENGKSLTGLTITSSVAALTAGSTFTGGTISSSTLSSNTITGGTASGVAITGGTISSTTVSGSTLSGNTITGGTVSGLSSDLAIADGGTGASTASDALTNLGVSTFAKTLLDDATQAEAQTTLGIINSLIPVGAILPCAADTFPSTFVLCAGQEISRTTYSVLFGLIGTTYGSGDGSTTFNVPDLRDRVPLGTNNMGGTDAARISTHTTTLGATGGVGSVTLTQTQIPSHTHSVNINTNWEDNHTHTVPTRSVSGYTNAPTVSNYDTADDVTDVTTSAAGGHFHNVNGNTGSTGGGGSHDNVQPFVALNYIMRAL